MRLPAGAYTALVTPFDSEASRVDWDAFDRLLESQIEGGIAGLIPCGTTGEAATLSDAEQRELAVRTVTQVSGRASVVVGAGSNDTKKTLRASRAAVDAGADGIMLVMPYYSRPSQEGLFQHVATVARDVPLPIMLYNIPGRTAVELGVETLLRILDACPNVVALKDASGTVLYCQELLQRAAGRIRVFSGDDVLTLPSMSLGAEGVVSVTSNLYPGPVSAVVREALAGRFVEARALNARLFPVHRALFSEPSPQPIKAALALSGRMQQSVRLPLVEAGPECRARLAEVMRAYEAT